MSISQIIADIERTMEKATPGPWYGRGPKGSESYGGGCVATTETHHDKDFQAIADTRSHSSGIGQQQADGNREYIAACNPRNIAALISAYRELQRSLAGHEPRAAS